MNKLCLYTLLCACVVFSIVSTPAQAELIDNGRGLVYDTVLDITWAQPENAQFGQLNWADANSWAAGLTLGGVSGWRLAYASVAAGAGPLAGSPVDCSTASEPDCQDNELGYMFYQNMEGNMSQPIPPNGNQDALALFPGLETALRFWTGTEGDSNEAWPFHFINGTQFAEGQDQLNYLWAVHEGNISGVPTSKASWGTIKAIYK